MSVWEGSREGWRDEEPKGRSRQGGRRRVGGRMRVRGQGREQRRQERGREISMRGIE